MRKKALLWDALEDNKVCCRLCPHECIIPEQGCGICEVRSNEEGRLLSLNYGRIVACAADPIEKKPLYHFMPGTMTYSVSAPGCNFLCGFCQNSSISQVRSRQDLSGIPFVSPDSIVSAAIESGSSNISYTYTEPTVFLEYALDIASIAKEEGLKNIFVTNGFMSFEALKLIGPSLDAANIDLKYFSEENYRKICGGRLQPVLDTIRRMRELGIWIEITTLIIPGENDSDETLSEIAGFISTLGKEIPWHISKYFPSYKYTGKSPSTSEEILERAESAGRAVGLKYIYRGNSRSDSSTYCPECGNLLIKRSGYKSEIIGLISGKRCSDCGRNTELIT